MQSTLGRYTLRQKLATGGMAEIWLANLTGPGGFSSQVVIKTILPHMATRPEFVKMFLSEARLAAQLHHPNIAQIFELGEEDGTHFLAMEYVPGVDLRRLYRDADAQQRPVPPPLAIRIVIEVAQALGYAHTASNERGEPLRVVHRDVSPENILVTYQGGVKLVDFGIAKAIDEISDTRTGVLKGKYSYMSPERVEGLAFDGRADLFSLGVVAFEMLTGLRLFRRESDLATIQAVAECDVPFPSTIAPQLPTALDAILMQALARAPEDRYPDGETFALAFEQFLHDQRYEASASHLAAYLRDLYPTPGLPPEHSDAETESTTGARPRVDLKAAPARRRSPTPQLRSPTPPTRSVAPRASTPPHQSVPPLNRSATPQGRSLPPRDRSPLPEEPTLEPSGYPPYPEVPQARRISQLAPRGPIQDPRVFREERTEDEALLGKSAPISPRRPSNAEVPIAEPDDGDGEPEARPLNLRRWARRGAQLVFFGGLIALGFFALPSLRRAVNQLPADLSADNGAGHGLVSVVSTPGAAVFLGDRHLGDTPLAEAEVPAGPQKLHLVNDAEALDETLDVVITPDQTLNLRPSFPEGTVAIPIPPGHHYRVLYKDKLLGKIPGPAIQICAGQHDLVLVDERTGKRETRHVTVVAAGD